MLRYIPLIVLVMMIPPPPVCAHIIHVPADSMTIQGGIDGAADGDTVLVDPGVYAENINFREKEITVASLFLTTGDPGYISGTTIDKAQDGPVVTFTGDIGPDALLSGFSITNSTSLYIGNMIACLQSSPTLTHLNVSGSVYDPMVSGGGLWCMNYSSPTVSHVEIAHNAAASGGGIYCYLYSSPDLRNVTVRNNFALFGGGIYCNHHSSPTLSNVVIADNSAENMGGGMECYDHSSPVMTNVIISGNSAEYGGGIYAGSHVYPILTNVTVTGNSATLGGGARLYSNANPTFTNSIFWNDSPYEIYLFDEYFNSTTTISYCDIQGGEDGIITNGNFTGTILWLEGNIDVAPRFVPFPFRGFDYLLIPGSPCIDAGDPLILDGFGWPQWYPNGTRSDMGAYGGPGNAAWLSRRFASGPLSSLTSNPVSAAGDNR